MEEIPLPDASVDVVISNGVINLSLQIHAFWPRSAGTTIPIEGYAFESFTALC
jgi:hypothetical protein